jgi:hypothetical protein
MAHHSVLKGARETSATLPLTKHIRSNYRNATIVAILNEANQAIAKNAVLQIPNKFIQIKIVKVRIFSGPPLTVILICEY